MCGADTTSEDAFWDDARVPTNCKPFDKALDICLNEYVQILALSATQLPMSTCTSVRCLPMNCSPSNPIFSFVPHTEPMSKRLK